MQSQAGQQRKHQHMGGGGRRIERPALSFALSQVSGRSELQETCERRHSGAGRETERTGEDSSGESHSTAVRRSSVAQGQQACHDNREALLQARAQPRPISTHRKCCVWLGHCTHWQAELIARIAVFTETCTVISTEGNEATALSVKCRTLGHAARRPWSSAVITDSVKVNNSAIS